MQICFPTSSPSASEASAYIAASSALTVSRRFTDCWLEVIEGDRGFGRAFGAGLPQT